MEEGPQIIAACGGDGTINEVASCLINTVVILGIIPMGSGNGLAPKYVLKNPEELRGLFYGRKGCKYSDLS